ncbi:hypothetical protein BN2475_130035 [Paraburkholderia ribeironis]|uniref:Uncharacterized protein n=1 Tax=Paraburkholderia ribeironis TaxID=1247936 RepID=A0A1N7RS84_9BURK|nr:hypothetical protein BN2475_130035 [Paraburkholderia ribeironis]
MKRWASRIHCAWLNGQRESTYLDNAWQMKDRNSGANAQHKLDQPSFKSLLCRKAQPMGRR